MSEQTRLPRMSWVLLSFINAFTFGIYSLVWYYQVLKEMNKLNETPENGKYLYRGLVISYSIALVFYTVGRILYTIGLVGFSLSEESIDMFQGAQYFQTLIPTLTHGIIYIVIFIAFSSITKACFILFSLQFRSILIKKCNLKIASFWTYAFTLLNIQYAINRAYRTGALTKEKTTAALM